MLWSFYTLDVWISYHMASYPLLENFECIEIKVVLQSSASSLNSCHQQMVLFICCSVAKLCPTLCNPMDCSTPDFLSLTISWSLLKFMFIELVMPSNHINLCHPLLFLPSIFPSIRIFSDELALRIKWPKYQSFSFSISLSKEYLGLIFFRIDWFDLLAVQGTLKSLSAPQFKSISSLVLSLLSVQLSYLCKTNGKTIVAK